MSNRLLTKEEMKAINDNVPSNAKYGDVFGEIAKAQRDLTAEIVRAETLKEVGEVIEKEHGIAVSVEYPHDAKYTVSKEFIEALKKGERVQPLGDTAKKRYRHILKKMKNGGQDGDK